MIFVNSKIKCFSCSAVCPGVRESSQQVSQVRDAYRWVLNIPSKNLRMNFQEVNHRLRRSYVKRKDFILMY